jgi:SOS-response transcriptional repressor LexA
MNTMNSKMPITESEKRMACRLKKLYLQKKVRMKSEGDNLTYEHVAESIKRTPGAVSHFMNGTTPMNESMCYKMARFFGVNVGAINPDLAEVLPNSDRNDKNVTELPDLSNSTPLISWAQAGAHNEANTPYKTSDSEKRILCPVPHSSKTFALRVNGLSMFDPGGSPSFEEGDIIHADPEVTVKHKSLVVVVANGDTEATFRQLIIEGGRYFLKALNPDWPNPIKEMRKNSRICGVVICKTVSYL